MKNNLKGGFVSYIVIIMALTAIIGGAYYFFTRPNKDTKMETGEMMMEEDTTMQVPAPGYEGVDEMMVGEMMDDEKTKDTMLEQDGEMMMEEEGAMMKEDDEMTSEESMMKEENEKR